MDKYEYKLRAEEIRELVKEKKYKEAMLIVESIDWNRVRGASMLTIASEVLKVNRRYEESRDILLLAYERHPGKRSIVFSLCELCLKMGDYISAVNYYKEFIHIATRDSRRYILQYKIFESQDVGLDERISVLEEYKRHDYRERWAYELAYLYHKGGYETKCVEECDQIIVWFGEGKYVKKALELKMLHQDLTSVQKAKYERMEREELSPSNGEFEVEVKPMDMSKYNTINLQQELAQSMQEFIRVTNDAEKENKRYEKDGFVFEEPILNPETQQEFEQELTMTENILQELSDTTDESLEVEERSVVFEEEATTVTLPAEAPVTENVPQISRMLHQDVDGQIRLLVPDSQKEASDLEVQITGQLCISDILIEWERMKQENEQRHQEDIRRKVQEQTCDMFSEFDAQTRAEIRADLKRLSDGITARDYVPPTEDEVDNEEMQFDENGDLIEPIKEVVEETSSIEETLVPDGNLSEEQMSEEKALVEEDLGEYVGAVKAMDTTMKEISFEDEIDPDVEDENALETEEPETPGEVVETEESEVLEEDVETEESEVLEEDEETEESEVLEDVVETEESEVLEDVTEIEDTEEFEEAQKVEVILEQIDEYEDDLFEAEEEARLHNEKKSCMIASTKNFHSERDTEDFQKEVEKELKKQEAKLKEGKKKDGKSGNKELKLSPEDQKLFGAFIQSQETKRQIAQMIDRISLASYSGNVIITADIEERAFDLAKCVIKQMQRMEDSFSGKAARITAGSLVEKGIELTIHKLKNGALIVEKAGMFSKDDMFEIRKALQKEDHGLLMILIDTNRAMNRLVTKNECILNEFNVRIDIEELDNDALVRFGVDFANSLGYCVDELAELALHSKISENQTCVHAVDIREVEELIHEAIESVHKKNVKHFAHVLFKKRYDEENRIILREKDFVNY